MNAKLAVAIDDLFRIPTDVRQAMLSGRLDTDNPIAHVGEPRREPVAALEFCCDLLDACTIVDILRSRDVANNNEPTRVYVRHERVGSTWCKIPGNVQLTMLVNDEVMLNKEALAIREESTSACRDMAEAVPIVSTASRLKNRLVPRIGG